MEAALGTIDAELFTASSGNDALSLMMCHDFAVVLLDVQVPEMDGFELAGIIRENEVTRRTPIIFVTAINKDAEYVFKGYKTDAVDYLFKPLHPEILQAKVDVFLQLHRQKAMLARANQELEQRNAELIVLSALCVVRYGGDYV